MKKLLTLVFAFTIGTSFLTRAQINEVESNNELVLANDLPLNIIVTGQTCTIIDADWYRVILTEDGFLKIRTSTAGEGDNPNAPFIFTLFTPTSNPWNSFSPTTGENGVMIADSSGWCCLHAGTFYIKVQRDYAFEYCYDYSFSLELLPATFQNDLEPNSTITGELVTIDYNTPIDGHVSFISDPQNAGTDSYDYFKIIPPSNGLLRMFVESEAQSTGSNDIKIKMHNADGNEWYQQTSLVGAFQSPNTDTLYWECTPDDTLILLVLTNNLYDRGYSYRIRYDMIAPVFGNDVEPNNTSATAQVIDLAIPAMGNQYNYGDNSDDIFKFVLPDTGFFKVRITSTTNSADGFLGTKLQLLDNNYNYINQLNAPIGTLGELAVDSLTMPYLDADTFYLRVFSDYIYAACRSYLLEFFYNDLEDNVNEFTLSHIGIYPNPSNGRFIMDTRQISGDGVVSVFNSMGEVVMMKNIVFGSQKELVLNDCASGIYFIKTTSGNKSKTQRLIVE